MYRIQPASLGHVVQPTLDYIFDGQDGLHPFRGTLRCARMLPPDESTCKEWLESCLTIGNFEGFSPLDGWSPGRSACVRVSHSLGAMLWQETYYFRAGDFERFDIASSSEQLTGESFAAWLHCWVLFLIGGVNLLIAHGKPPWTRMRGMVLRELSAWEADWCTRLAVGLQPGPSRTIWDDVHIVHEYSWGKLEEYRMRCKKMPFAWIYVVDYEEVLALVLCYKRGFWSDLY